MNRDEIIRMARKSAILDVMDCQYPAVEQALERFAALVAAAEREACAKACDPEPSPPNESYIVLNNKATMRRCAAAIRERGQS